MLENFSDTVVGVVGLSVFLVLAYAGGRLINAGRHRRFTRDWQPLVPVIGGTVHEDPGGGGASSWLVGSFGGRTIHASMSPDIRRGEDSGYENRFSQGVAELDGHESWYLSHHAPLFGSGAGEWSIQAKEDSLAQRLTDAGVIDIARTVGPSTVSFDPHGRILRVEQDIRPLRVPSDARFRQLLDVALQLAVVNERTNARGMR
jgi:hypothetical protein